MNQKKLPGMAYLCLLFFITILPSSGKSQNTYTWTGNQDTFFFKSENWEGNPSIENLKTAGNNYYIPLINTSNYPVYNENVFRTTNIALINSDLNSSLNIKSYILLVNNTTLNGNLNIDGGGINIRNSSNTIVYNFSTGLSNINITNGGSLNARNQMHIASNNGSVIANVKNGTISNENSVLSIAWSGTATINIQQAGLLKSPNLRIGANGTINLSETGSITTELLTLNGKISLKDLANITITGDVRSNIQTHIDAGRIFSSEGKSINTTYNSETNKTVITSGNSMQWISKEGAFIVLTNGIVTAKIEETTSKIKSFKVNGIELLAQTNSANASRVGHYHDFTFGSDEDSGFEVISGTTFSIKESNDDYIDVSFKKMYNNSGIPLDVDIHYVLKKGESGIYTYNILTHQPTYPEVNIGSWRQVFWIANDGAKYTTEKIFVTDKKKWTMPSLTDTWESTGIAEIVKMTSGPKAGKYDGKYEYVEDLVNIPAYGFASDINKVGLWAITPNYESFNGGPTHQDLNAAAGIIHICMNGIHYGESGYKIAAGEDWSKIYGPYMLYASTKNTAEENWMDAKTKAEFEKNQWPYSWLTNTASYPLTNLRGNLTGTFKITDSYKPNITGKNSWIGLTQLSGDHGWEMESKNYQYWVKTDENGNFNISARPGTYTLFAYTEGIIEEYKLENVTINEGATNNLGIINWNLNRTKKILWEIGVANRNTSEFKMGDLEYSEGFTYEKFSNYFSQTIEYNVSDKNWSEKIPYVHSKYPINNTYNTPEQWIWHINFNLPDNFNPNNGENIDLNIAFASNAKAQYWIYVNNRNRTSTFNFNGYPEATESNSFVRQANHGKYSYKTFSIARNKLKAGANTITFIMPSNSTPVSHVMYDYISLAGDETMVLPINLSTFNIEKNKNDVSLKWMTAKETDNNKFIIEKLGTDGIFYSIGEVAAKNTASSYSFIDQNPFIGENYYRLIQVDLDGKENIFGPLYTYFSLNNNELFNVYPNPIVKNINISINNNIKGLKQVILTDLTGKNILKTQTHDNFINLDVSSKTVSGMYLLTIKSEKHTDTQKIIIK